MTKFAKFFNGKESKTISDATKKKKLSIIGIIVCVVLMILTFVLIAITGISALGAIAFVALFPLFFFWLKLNCARKEIFKLKNLYCQKCGERFSYGDSTYQIVSTKKFDRKAEDHIDVDTYTTVKIKCKCKKCNDTHEFEYDFLTKKTKTNLMGAVLSENTYSLEDRISEFFTE